MKTALYSLISVLLVCGAVHAGANKVIICHYPPGDTDDAAANDVFQRTATITWTTDEPASGLGLFCPVYYYAISVDVAGDGAISAEHMFRTLR